MSRAAVALLSVLGAWIAMACAPPDPAPPAPDTPPLLASVQASAAGGEVRFVLQVTNTTAAPLSLRFASGQSFDFVVRQAGRELWRWGADQMFTQALRTEVLGPGETRSYRAEWTPPAGAAGELEVTGVLTAQEHRVEQTTRFRVP